jgi:hypothetical protein
MTSDSYRMNAFAFARRVGWDWTFALMRYGSKWKEHRRIFHNRFDATISEHRRIQIPAAHELVRLLEQSPDKSIDHLEQ